MVMPFLSCFSKSGMNCDTGSLNRIRPSSTSRMTLVVVATTLVSDARSKIVSSVIASGDEDDGAGQFVTRDRGVHERGDRRESSARFARDRRRLRERRGGDREGR